MEEFRTYVYERNPKKVRKRFLYNTLLLIGILLVIYLTFSQVMGIGLGLISGISLTVALIKMKLYDDKYMGITAYGDRKSKFFITENSFKMDDIILPFSELEDLVIYVDEYAGMPRQIFGIHHGGNNEITFSHNGNKVSINYIIKDKNDFKYVEALVNKIENNQKLKVYNK